jgi:hypothetical protein
MRSSRFSSLLLFSFSLLALRNRKNIDEVAQRAPSENGLATTNPPPRDSQQQLEAPSSDAKHIAPEFHVFPPAKKTFLKVESTSEKGETNWETCAGNFPPLIRRKMCDFVSDWINGGFRRAKEEENLGRLTYLNS